MSNNILYKIADYFEFKLNKYSVDLSRQELSIKKEVPPNYFEPIVKQIIDNVLQTEGNTLMSSLTKACNDYQKKSGKVGGSIFIGSEVILNATQPLNGKWNVSVYIKNTIPPETDPNIAKLATSIVQKLTTSMTNKIKFEFDKRSKSWVGNSITDFRFPGHALFS